MCINMKIFLGRQMLEWVLFSIFADTVSLEIKYQSLSFIVFYSVAILTYFHYTLTDSVLQYTSLSPTASLSIEHFLPSPALFRYGGRRRQAVHQTSSRKHPSTMRRCASRASRGCRGVATTARPTTGWGWLPSSPSA